jgi:hypothetical protein
MIGGRTRFSPDELPIAGGRVMAPEIAASMGIARELEVLATAETPAPSEGFTSRVMAAVWAEPAPQPVIVFARALAAGRLVGMLTAVRDAWRVSTSAGRPAPVRAQALVLVLLALLALGSLAGIAGAAMALFDSRPPDPTVPTRPAIVQPSPSSDRLPQLSPTPTPSPTLETTPPPTPTARPTATVRPTNQATPRPAATPRRTASPEPTETDDDHHGGGDSPSPSDNSGPGGGGG